MTGWELVVFFVICGVGGFLVGVTGIFKRRGPFDPFDHLGPL